ncbi:hypothetical protein AXG93_4620s1930 [Marchantia polymorpha subsp. ruderalis]|uniref:Uncharacterized protein n=1 Tax=Marchantia polymorpha subsp. ruderalis TaxID=1480154 RepID=A0A176VX36_MARPO|nr:hypothetical protein AXG93_4620s1930 [Marchantia polymorpha subsp. ruderalis]
MDGGLFCCSWRRLLPPSAEALGAGAGARPGAEAGAAVEPGFSQRPDGGGGESLAQTQTTTTTTPRWAAWQTNGSGRCLLCVAGDPLCVFTAFSVLFFNLESCTIIPYHTQALVYSGALFDRCLCLCVPLLALYNSEHCHVRGPPLKLSGKIAVRGALSLSDPFLDLLAEEHLPST